MGPDFTIYSYSVFVSIKPYMVILLGMILKPVEDNWQGRNS